MSPNLIHILIVLIFIQKSCECTPVYTFEVTEEYHNNNIDDSPLRTRSQDNSHSIDNTVNSSKDESKKKSCGQILIETLPLICQHSAYVLNYQYSDSYEDYSGPNEKMKNDIIEECCVHRCSFQDLINFCSAN